MDNPYNITEVNQEELFELCKFFISNNENVFIFGSPGVGKTQIAEKVAKELGYKVSIINLSVIDKSDLAGYPDLFSKEPIVNYKSPFFLQELTSDKPDTVIIFDEIDKADSSTTFPLLEILQKRSLLGKKLNIAGCIMTSNLLLDGCFSNEISKALLDRGPKYILKFDFDKWLDWARQNNVNELIISFLMTEQNLCCYYKDEYYSQATPRGWTEAAKAITIASENNIINPNTIMKIVSGYVGDYAAKKFEFWYTFSKKFENKVKMALTGKTIDNFDKLSKQDVMIFTILMAKEAKNIVIKSNGKNLEPLDYLYDFFQKYNIEKEMQLMALYNSFSFETVLKYELFNSIKFYSIFSSYLINKKMRL